MKLRNKKTGEVVVEVNKIGLVWNRFGMPAEIGQYDSLAELNEVWEDYKPAEKKSKRYRLVKDLPTFDKGDEFYIAQTGALWYDGGGADDVCAYSTQTLMRFPNILKDWFEPIDDEDINVTNIQPLIKDEKIRKAVRAWAEANGFTKLKFNEWADNHWILRAENKDRHEFDIDFFDNDCKKLPKYVYDAFYTIDELCGAPEPLEPTFVDMDERIKEKEEE